MKVAIPSLEDRVSPVFDVAQAIVLAEFNGDRVVRRQVASLHSNDVTRRAAELAQHDVDVLICGAISRSLEATLVAAGIRVIPQRCGSVEDILRAFVVGRLNNRAFLMPGCCGRRRGGRGARQRARRGRQQAGRPTDEQKS